MPSRRPGPWRPAVVRRLTVALALAALAGCSPTPGVSKYTAPKDPPDTDLIDDQPAAAGAATHPAGGEPAVRILGAIVPTGQPDDWFFFKMQSKPKAIERHAADFDAFI